MIIEILGFIVIVVVVLLAWSHFNPTGTVATTVKSVQTSAIDASITTSNLAEKATADVVALELSSMKKWFSAAAQPHLDALVAENEAYRTGVSTTK